MATCLDLVLEGAGWGAVAGCMAQLHHEPRCREAWAAASRSHARWEIVADVANVCATSYCPELGQPRPRLCAEKAHGDSPLVLVYFAELEGAILSRDAGLRDHPGLLGRLGATLVALAPMPAIAELPGGLEVTLPGASSQDREETDTPLIVWVRSEGSVAVDGKRLSDGELRRWLAAASSKNPELQLVIKADEGTSYERIVSVLEMAKSVGISRLAIAADGDSSE